jgi:predicted dehydrogenase
MNKLNIAVIGCGYIANGHLRSWNKIPKAKVTAVVDLNVDLARKTADEWKVDRYFSSSDELYDELHPDVVDICTPPQTHRMLAVQSMSKEINTLIEKPMTMTVKDSELILETESKTNTISGVIHNWLFEPPIPKVRELVKEGKIGKVNHVDLKALNTKDDWMARDEKHWCHKLQGGRFGEMLTHPIYLVKYFLGEVELLDLKVSKIGPYSWMKSDELVAILGGGDRFGTFYATFNSPRQAIILNLYGEKALLSIDMINGTINLLPSRPVGKLSIATDSVKQASQIVSSTIGNVGTVVTGGWMTGHDEYIKQYSEALLNGGTAPVTLKEGYDVIKILEQMIAEIERQEK